MKALSFRNIILEKDENVAVIKINRPEKLNALNKEVILELAAAVEEMEKDDDIRAVIITGAGETFVAGADIAWMKSAASSEMEEFVKLGKNVFDKIEKMGKPVIAAVNGPAFGGGCELALACDIRIASEKAKLGQLEVNVGIMPGWGGTQRLPRLVGLGKAKEICLTGDVVDAKEAERIGLINRVVRSEELVSEAKKLAERLASKPPVALSCIKAALNFTSEASQRAGMEYETKLFSTVSSTEDRYEGLSAFLEKRKPRFKGR